jgi:hypothetical protein
MSSLKLKTPSGGSVSFNATDTANDVTLTVPASNATLLTTTNMPAPSELSTATGSAPSYSARAWVNFNGTGTVAIRESGNVSSITDLGTGYYTINFTTAMPDANYSIVGNTNGYDFLTFATTSAFNLFTVDTGTNGVDNAYVFLCVFR